MAIARLSDPARTATLFHALSDPTRLEILARLRSGEQCVCDLMSVTGAAQSRLSFHLRVLKDAGLVTDRREGRWAYYRVVDEALTALHDCVVALVPVPTGRVSRRTMPLAIGRCCG